MTLKNESVLTFDGLGKLVWFVIKGKKISLCFVKAYRAFAPLYIFLFNNYMLFVF
jgi:hypothetical protein